MSNGLLRVETRHSDGQIDVEFTGPIAIQAMQLDTNIPAPGQFVTAPGHVLTPTSSAVSYNSITYAQAGRIQLVASSPGLESARSPMIELTGSLALAAPGLQVTDQLSFQRDATPANLPLFAFRATPTGEPIFFSDIALRLGSGGGMRAVDIDSLYLWRDRDAIGQLDLSDQPLASAAVVQDSLACFGGLTDTLQTTETYLVTWSAQSALVAGWTLQAQLHPEDLLGRSSRASGLETPVTGSLLSGAWHRVGDTGPPYGILLSAQNANLAADDLSRTSLEATIVDAHNRPIASDHVPTVTFSMLSAPAFIEGPMAVQIIDGRAMTQLRAGNSTGTARVLASAPGLHGDTLKVVLRAGSVAALELSADPPSIHLDETDRAELTALLRDARGNAIDRSGDRVQFSLGSLGTFPAGLAAVNADSGVARSVVTVAEPGTLRVQARAGDAIGQLDIPVINTQPPYATPAANSSSKTTRRQCVSRWCRGTPCSMPTKS